MKHHMRLSLVPIYLVLCLIFGGASAAGFWGNLFLQLLGLALIFWSLVVQRRTPIGTPGRQLLALLLLLLAVALLQLVPLPPSIWTKLPGRDAIVRGYELLGQALPWLPISLAPHKTLSSILWLLPAVATLVGIVKLGAFKATWIAWAIAGVTIISVAVGALQLSGGHDSAWYFYDITNYGVATGFFSNGNHEATLLVAAMPFLAALYLSSRSKGQSAQASSGMLVVLAGSLMVVLVGIAINGSLAGFGLAVPSIGASLLMLLSRKRKVPAWLLGLFAIGAVGAIYLPFSAPLGNNLTSAEAQAAPYSRYVTFAKSIDAVGDFLPLGSGLGSFADLYPTYEDPDIVDRTWVNHVHSDYIELALETGFPGLLVLLCFLLWWLGRVVRIWRDSKPDYFARAASIASAVILAHSVVDYPLRTAAISALFAACIALMAEPRARVRRTDEPASEDGPRHLSAD
jgi:O-antigen ligase